MSDLQFQNALSLIFVTDFATFTLTRSLGTFPVPSYLYVSSFQSVGLVGRDWVVTRVVIRSDFSRAFLQLTNWDSIDYLPVNMPMPMLMLMLVLMLMLMLVSINYLWAMKVLLLLQLSHDTKLTIRKGTIDVSHLIRPYA